MGKYKHGLCKRKLYYIWTNIKQRCKNPDRRDFKNYGGRGIKVCKAWESYIRFHKWAMANGYKEGLTIDRRNNNGDYKPSNCRWVTNKAQQRNVRKNINIKYNGETKCLSEWCEIFDLNYKLSHQRMFRDGVSLKKLILDKGNTYEGNKCKLTIEEVKKIMGSSLTYSELADRYGVKLTTISSIKNGYTWNKVTGLATKRK